jgi:hypothetical protein
MSLLAGFSLASHSTPDGTLRPQGHDVDIGGPINKRRLCHFSFFIARAAMWAICCGSSRISRRIRRCGQHLHAQINANNIATNKQKRACINRPEEKMKKPSESVLVNIVNSIKCPTLVRLMSNQCHIACLASSISGGGDVQSSSSCRPPTEVVVSWLLLLLLHPMVVPAEHHSTSVGHEHGGTDTAAVAGEQKRCCCSGGGESLPGKSGVSTVASADQAHANCKGNDGGACCQTASGKVRAVLHEILSPRDSIFEGKKIGFQGNPPSSRKGADFREGFFAFNPSQGKTVFRRKSRGK